MGYGDSHSAEMVVVENTSDAHNVIVCTLLLLLPLVGARVAADVVLIGALPVKDVKEPRTVLNEFELELQHDVEVRVWDSLSELRYMVLPKRPEGTEHMTENELVALVTRDSMIGVAEAG